MYELDGGFVVDKTLEDKVLRIQNSDDNQERNDFIEQFIPFIYKRLLSVSYVTITKSHDEYSIALMIFNDCISEYNVSKGKFLAFAGAMLHYRLHDYYREVKTKNKWFQETTEKALEKTYVDLSKEYYFKELYDSDLKSDLRDELRKYSKELRKHGISFKKIKNKMVHHVDRQEFLYELACKINEDRELTKKILDKDQLPHKEIVESTGMQYSKRTHDHRRIPLLAILILLNGNYKTIKSIMKLK